MPRADRPPAPAPHLPAHAAPDSSIAARVARTPRGPAGTEPRTGVVLPASWCWSACSFRPAGPRRHAFIYRARWDIRTRVAAAVISLCPLRDEADAGRHLREQHQE